MKKTAVLLAMALASVVAPIRAQAQWESFGKNQVIWEKTTWNFYRSEHADFYVSVDIGAADVLPHMEALVGHLEKSYEFLSVSFGGHVLRKRPIVIVSRTHSQFEALRLSDDPTHPEGMGAYAMPRGSKLLPDADLMLVVKPDFLPVLNRTIVTHELVHIFQFDMTGGANFFRRAIGADSVDRWFYEASAEYKANEFAPHTRDDIRGMYQRVAAANARNPDLFPTLAGLRSGRNDPYGAGAMVPEFMAARYGKGRVDEFIVDVFKTRSLNFQELLLDISGGEFSSDEAFDRAHRDFWATRYAEDSLTRPHAYANTASASGRDVIRRPFPFPVTSPVVSPDGTRVAFLTYSQKNGIVLATAPTLPAEDPVYVPYAGRPRQPQERNGKDAINVLTRQMPPIPYEYVVAQWSWPFNGSDLAWHGDRIAFFAKRDRDHALFIVDAKTRKFLGHWDVPLDQAFSPAFSPDGKTVFFSAAHNIGRDIYSLNLATGGIANITNGGVFNTAPAVSPDGARIAYVAFVGDFQKLFLLDLATGARDQLTYGRYNDNSPAWSSDGTRLAYTSDEKDGVWNLYTMELESHLSKQWTNLYGGVFTPSYIPGENDRVVVAAFVDDHQYRGEVYPNFSAFEVRLKEPLRTTVIVPDETARSAVVRPEHAVGWTIDKRQLEHPQEPPARWKLYGGDVTLGASTLWGMFGYSRVLAQDILGNRTHAFMWAQGGDLKLLDYTYLDRSRRWTVAVNASRSHFPLRWGLYSITGELPRNEDNSNQFTLNNAWSRETSATLYASYPFNRFNRLEIGVRPRVRSFGLPYEVEVAPDSRAEDLRYYDFLTRSSGQTTLGLTAAYVRDTILYSQNTMGPLHGNAVRVQVERGAGLNGRSFAYATASLDARMYRRLSGSSVFAVRVAGMASTRPTGDFILLGGTDTLRGYPYLSVSGNNVGYGSAELRVPLADMRLFGALPFRVRGVVFSDYAVSRFNHDTFPTRREWAGGFGIQAWLIAPMNFEWARTKASPGWKFNFRIGLNF